MSILDRAKFYSVDDLGNSMQLSRAQKVLDSFTEGKQYSDVNDILELYNIKLLIVDNSLKLNVWSDDDYISYQNKAKLFPKLIVLFFRNHLDERTIEDIFKSVDYIYHQDFWDVFDSFGLYDLLSDVTLTNVLNDDPRQLENLLHCEKIVKKFDKLLTTEMLNNVSAPSLLVHAYWIKDVEYRRRPLFIPKSLSIEQKENILARFLDQDSPSLNLVRIIMQSKDVDGLKLNPETRLKAKRMEPALAEAEFKKATIVSKYQIGISLTFSKEKNIPPISSSIDGLELSFVYSEEYLDRLNSTQLFNVFITLFGYLNENGLLTLCYNPREDDFLESVYKESVSGIYRINDSFRRKNSLAVYQLRMFDEYLRRRGKSIEELIKSYYESHFRDDYGYPSLALNLPHEDDTFINKCRIIASEIEGVIKIFDLYTDKKEIDTELLQFRMSLPITLSKSMIYGKHKYAIIVDGENGIDTPMNLLFSNQSLLSYVDPFKNSNYQTLYNLLIHERSVFYSNYGEFQKPGINYLLQNGYIEVSELGYLRIKDVHKVEVLKKLYNEGEISYYHCELKERKVIEAFVAAGWLKYDEYLLSPNERHFINFYLNNAEYSNGYQLRNKYSHGVTPNCEGDKNEHQTAYYYFLMIFVIILLKMDVDFQLARHYLKRCNQA